MRKLFTLFLGLVICFVSVSCSCNERKITLVEEQYVEEGKLEFLSSYDVLKTKFENKENFTFFMYGATCSGCHIFTPKLQEYLKEAKIKMYAIEVNTLSRANRDLYETLGATPAVAIVKDGELYKFIEGYGKNDAAYFETKDGFKSWFEKYVNVK